MASNGRLSPSVLAPIPSGHLRRDAAAAFNAMNAEVNAHYGITLRPVGHPFQRELAMDKAFQSKLEFPSVYGGNATTAGTLALSPQNHSVTKRPMTLSVYKNKKVVPLAYFDLEAADYRTA